MAFFNTSTGIIILGIVITFFVILTVLNVFITYSQQKREFEIKEGVDPIQPRNYATFSIIINIIGIIVSVTVLGFIVYGYRTMDGGTNGNKTNDGFKPIFLKT